MMIAGRMPPWLVRNLEVGSARIPLNDVVRSALTLPLVLGISYLAWGTGISLYATLAALLVVLGERGGTTGQRIFKAGSALLAGTIAMALGSWTGGTGWTPLLVVMAFSAASGVMSAMGAALSFAGMQMLVQMSIAGGLSVPLPLATKLTAYVAGGGVALLGVALQSALERTEQQYAQGLWNALDMLSKWGRTPAGGPVEAAESRAARAAIDHALAEASELILTARPVRGARRRAHAELRLLRDETSVLTSAVFARGGASAEVLARIKRLQGDLRQWPDAGGAHRARDVQGQASGRPAIPVHTLFLQALRRPSTWIFVLRLVMCMVIAEIARQWSPLGHSYWLPLTAALALKPDIGSVFARSLQRSLGTILGMLIGWIAMWMAPGLSTLVIVGVLGAVIPYVVRRNYAWFAVIATPLVFILLDFAAPVDVQVLLQRLFHTLLACAIVFVFGYALWPGTWFPRADAMIARIRGDIERLALDASAHGRELPRVQWADRRLDIAREIDALRTRASKLQSEPRWAQAPMTLWLASATELDGMLQQVVEIEAISRPDRLPPLAPSNQSRMKYLAHT